MKDGYWWDQDKVDPNAIGILYVPKSLKTAGERSLRSFNTATIQPYETREGLMRVLSDPTNQIYLKDMVQRMNVYKGMWTFSYV